MELSSYLENLNQEVTLGKKGNSQPYLFHSVRIWENILF